MIPSAASRPHEGLLAYYRGSWISAPADEPTAFWYEVNHTGAVLRSIEVYRDGRAVADDISRYPGCASDFGFGTLIGDDFYCLEWRWPEAEDVDVMVMLDATIFEFECVWKVAAA
jgi:hypothetical protein